MPFRFFGCALFFVVYFSQFQGGPFLVTVSIGVENLASLNSSGGANRAYAAAEYLIFKKQDASQYTVYSDYNFESVTETLALRSPHYS